MTTAVPFLLSIPLTLMVVRAWAARFETKLSGRDVVLTGAAAWAAMLVAITELLSAGRWLHRQGVFIAWLTVCLIAVVVLALLKPPLRIFMSEVLASFKGFRSIHRLTYLISVCLIGSSLAVLAFIAFRFPPNTWDSMTYHLPRVMHWAQQGSVLHYATNIDRQIWNPPFAEFVLLHIQVLTGSDRWMNLVQWSALLLAVIGVSEICRKLGGDLAAQCMAAILAVSIPMGILQATSTQNDLVTTVWVVTLANLVLGFEASNSRWASLTMMGLCLGLAGLTKGTAVVYVTPLCVWLAILLIRRSGWRAIYQGIAVTGIALLVPFGHLLRNQVLYGGPIGPGAVQLNEVLSPGALASNMIRNVAIHVPLADPPGPAYRLGVVSLGVLEKLDGLTGFEATDPRISLTDDNIFVQPFGTWRDEDYAGNALHSLLILVGIAVIFLFKSFKSLRPYAIAIVASFLLFSLVFMWQPWGSRLQLPGYFLWVPILAIVIARRGTAAVLIVGLLVWGASVPWLIANRTRPLRLLLQPEGFARRSAYFAKRRDLYEPYLALADQIAGASCEKVGLELREDSWEYPIWLLLREKGFTGQIRHVSVVNESRIYEDRAFQACATVTDKGSRGIEVRLGSNP